ncbi:hypothetical protein [Streptomyces sp. RKAG290]|uniref:hypothetical protein n=1 Tax=Streptomyces sp. RKAG290 TaxID=2888348 RepID=UPI002033DF64|nr:hypothetical protein [Streptomyces sp. RKAG290]
MEESLALTVADAPRAWTAPCHLTVTYALAGLGRLDEALVAARGCVNDWADATTGRADQSPGGRIGALRAYACVLGWSGRTGESVQVYRQCHDALGELGLWRRSRLGLLYSRTLVELTAGLRKLAQYDEAVSVGDDARQRIDGPLLRLYPEGLSLRARLLSDLAWCRGATGELDRARETAAEAVDICRTLVARDSASGERRLVIALECLAHQLDQLDAHAEERVAQGELAALCERLAKTDPDAYEPALARALDGLARCHARAGEVHESVAAIERGVALCRRAAERDPVVHQPELARTLAVLSFRLRRTDAGEGAVAAAREALEITRRLTEPDGEAHRALVARRLRILGGALHGAADDEEAEACFTEAEKILRALMAAGDHKRHEADLEAVLSKLVVTLGVAVDAHLDAGRADEAVAALHRIRLLTRRTGQSDVHAACVSAFAWAGARDPEEVRRLWRRATGEPWPSFVYRLG